MRKMKKTIFAFVVLTTGILSMNSSFAQSARMTEKFIVEVPSSETLSSSYTVDVSSLNFNSVEQMETYFSGFNDDIVEFQIDRSSKTVTLNVKEKYLSAGKTPADLNTYLAKRADKMKEKYQAMRSEKSEEKEK